MVDQGEYATAQKYFQQSFEIPPGKADRGRYATVRAGLERIALLSGEYFEAYEHYEASTDAVLLASLVAHHPASYAESKDIALGVLNSPEASLFVASPVAAGRSNREIAQDLTLAVGTIKSQLHNILQKLDAKSRTQAVARARVLHLL
jgi:ATP/maltotriose-dependent transcriptional regulator MalT